MIQGQRSDVSGPNSDIVTVNFGRAGSGQPPFVSSVSVGGVGVGEGDGAVGDEVIRTTSRTIRRAA